MTTGTTYWVITLLVFNTLLISFMGFFGQTFADDVTVTEFEDSNIPNFALGVVVGFSTLPIWVNAILSIQGAIAIYLLISTITGGS